MRHEAAIRKHLIHIQTLAVEVAKMMADDRARLEQKGHTWPVPYDFTQTDDWHALIGDQPELMTPVEQLDALKEKIEQIERAA